MLNEVELKIEHVLMLVIVAFVLYHFMVYRVKCSCGNGFSVDPIKNTKKYCDDHLKNCLKNNYCGGLDLTQCDFTKNYLVNANLNKVYLNDANLTNANLEGASLVDADLSGANLTNAILTNATIRETKCWPPGPIKGLTKYECSDSGYFHVIA